MAVVQPKEGFVGAADWRAEEAEHTVRTFPTPGSGDDKGVPSWKGSVLEAGRRRMA